MDYPYEASDEASESELLDSSLSRWRGGWHPLESKEIFDPIPLDLYTASSIGQYDCVNSIIVSGEVDLNKKNIGGWTTLMYACYIGHDNIVNLLLDAGVDVNIKSNKGRTALMLAASCGNESVVFFLLQAGADIESVDNRGWTALFHATNAGHQNMVKFLLNNDGNANHREPSVGNTALMMAAAEGHEIIVQNLLQYGIEIEAKNYNGDTARSLALLNGHMKIVSLIDNQTLPLTLLRAEPGLHVDEDLSSSDEYYRRPTRPPTKSQRCRSKHANNTGPSIRDAPEAMARLLNESRSKAITDNKLAFSNPIVPSGYMTFQDDGSVSQDAIRHRDVTSPISPSEHDLDSSTGKDSLWLEKYGGGDEEPFCVSGAVTIKSASSSCSSSTGGLAAVLGLQQLSVDSADDAAAPSIERESTAMDTTSDDMVMHAKYCEEKKQTQLYDKSDNIESSHSVDGEQTSVQTSQQIVKCEVNDATNQNKPLVTTENQNKPLVTSSNQNKSLVTSTNQNKPLITTANQNKPLVTTANQNKPVLSTANTLQETASGGNPLEGINLDAYCENFNLPGKNKGQTLHYKDLSELLESLNLSKYHHVFDEQDVDLRLFLTLTDMDLKEVGIKLFGPRRKMTSAIARWHSQSRPFSDSLEQAYADRVETEMQEMAIQLHKAIKDTETATAQVLQEKELRNVVEGCLMEDKRAWQHVHGLATDTRKICYDIKLLYESIRLCQEELTKRLTILYSSTMNAFGNGTMEHTTNQIPGFYQPIRMHDRTNLGPVKDRKLFDDRSANQSGNTAMQCGARSQMIDLSILNTDEVISMLDHYTKQMGRAVSMATFNMDQLVGQERSSYPQDALEVSDTGKLLYPSF